MNKQCEVYPDSVDPPIDSLPSWSYGSDLLTSVSCPKDQGHLHWLNTETGEVRPYSCRAVSCSVCGENEARRRVQAVAKGGTTGSPSTYWVLDRAPEDWRSLQNKLTHLKRKCSRPSGVTWEFAWTVEPYRSNGIHINLVTKGDQPDHADVARTWGDGVFSEPIYNAHSLASYVVKAQTWPRTLPAHVQQNHGRVYHCTRSYFGAWTMAEAIRKSAPRSDDWILTSH